MNFNGQACKTSILIAEETILCRSEMSRRDARDVRSLASQDVVSFSGMALNRETPPSQLRRWAVLSFQDRQYKRPAKLLKWMQFPYSH